VSADPALREALAGLTNTMLIRRCAQLEATTPHDVTSAAVYTLHVLARRILELTEQIHDLVQRITDTITTHCPTLLTHRGIGPDTAAALLITAGDNPDRLHSETSFAALCGVSPLEASSGKNHPSPAQSRRRPPSQCRALPHRLIPIALGRPYPRLPHPSHHRRQNPSQSHSLLKALHRSRDVPDPHIPTANTAVSGLTSIGASVPNSIR
jgi:Transposase IS116/IS110/IS902 family